MAESNATQVILTDDGIKIIKAQNTANNAASQASKADSAALIAQSKANSAKSAADSTYAYASSEIAVQSTATAKAQSKADDAFSKAQEVGNQASKDIAVQSTATAKAQSTADSAFSKATTAIDTGNVTSQAVTALKGGSKLTLAELENGLATKVANSDYASYKTQTASQIGQLVTNGAFSAYQQTTADLISQKVATKDFSAYQDTTAKSIESKVESNDFNTYKSQTADTIAEKVATKDFSAYQATTAKSIESKVESKDFNTYKSQTADLIAEKVANKDFSTYKSQTADLIASKVATKDFSAYQDTTAKSIESKVESNDFNTYKSQTADMISSKVSTADFNSLTISNRNLALGTATEFKMTGNNIDNQLFSSYTFAKVIPRGTVVTVTFDIASSTGVGDFTMQFYGGDSGSSWQVISNGKLVNGTKHVSATLTTDSEHLSVWPRFDYATGDVTISNFIISESSKEVSWTPAPEDQATQSQITQLSNDINLRVTKGDLIDEINLKAGSTLISSSGQLTLSGKNIYFDTANPVIIPSANITGTLTGKTINAGTKLNQYGNTDYPLTIYPDGSLHSTTFKTNPVGTGAQRASLKDGIFSTNLRGMTSFDNGKYLAADAMLQAGQLALYEGYSTSQDASFTNNSLHATGYVIVDASNGMKLHGDNQQITFNGTSDDVTPKGIIITPYGNINPNGTQNTWYVGNNMSMKTAQFGIDANNKVGIDLFRPTFVDEIGAKGNRLANGRLLLHATDENAQMYLLNDGKPAFVSPTIYNRTYSNGSNMFVTSSGRVGRSTSASKYKLAIARSDDTLQADRLMTLNLASWNDKVATEKMAESLSNGETPAEAEINLKRHYGLIAEDLRDAGLDEFLITGKDGQIEGIEYDRLWTVLIPKIKQLNNRINELERKTL